jgi:hypothetical protein
MATAMSAMKISRGKTLAWSGKRLMMLLFSGTGIVFRQAGGRQAPCKLPH